jgi:hypothetical protein
MFDQPLSDSLNFPFFFPTVVSVPDTASENAPSPVNAPLPVPFRRPVAPERLPVPSELRVEVSVSWPMVDSLPEFSNR